MIDTLNKLHFVIYRMEPGQRLNLDRHFGFSTFWPNPPWRPSSADDDGLTPKERGEQWCRDHGCTIIEYFDPPGLVITKDQSA